MTTARIFGFPFTMVTAGNDIITGMLSGSACLLTQHRDQRAKLIANRALIANAVEELVGRCPDFPVDVTAGAYARGPYVRRQLSSPWAASCA